MPLGTLQNTNKRKCGDGDASVGGLVVFRLDLFMALTDVLKIVGGARKAMTIPEREAIAENTVRRIASKPGNAAAGASDRPRFAGMEQGARVSCEPQARP
jgi:hypothetical protein